MVFINVVGVVVTEVLVAVVAKIVHSIRNIIARNSTAPVWECLLPLRILFVFIECRPEPVMGSCCGVSREL